MLDRHLFGAAILALAACAPKSDETVESAAADAKVPKELGPAVQREPFGPVHAAMGDPYALTAEPQVSKGVLRVPVRHAEECAPRAFDLEVKAISPQEPRIAAVALTMDSKGLRCETEETRILEFDLEELLEPGCYETLVLEAGGQTRQLPLRGLGCEGQTTTASIAVPIEEYRARWGDRYRLERDPDIVQGKLMVTARYSGGCAKHVFKVHFGEFERDRQMSAVSADLVHDAQHDSCDALRTEHYEIDLQPWLQKDCPRLLELHVPDVLPTGDVFDREILIEVDPHEDCGRPATERTETNRRRQDR